MYSHLKPVYRSLCLMAMCVLFTSAFSACSSGDSGGGVEQSGDPGAFPPGSGGVVFGITWQRPPANAQAPRFAPSFNSCVDFGIDTISATVSNGTTTVASGSWPCSLHGGSILAVPAGTNYTLQVDGISAGPTTWRGLTSSITVNASQITNAGTIVMNYIGEDSTEPIVSSLGPKSNPTITTNVPATDRVAVVFDSPMAISTITTNNIALKLIDNTAVTGTISYNAGSNTAAFTPSTTLAYDTQYVIEVISCVTATCITDTAGNQLATNYTNTFTTESAPVAVPGAPSGVTATPGNGQVTLDWLASNGATSYNVYYGLSSGSTNTQIPGVQPPFVHLGRANGQTYFYIVRAANGFGESSNSSEVNATPAFPAGNPLPPATLSVTSSSGQNIVTWPPVSGATSYNLYWSTSFITFGKYAADNVIRDATSSFTHTGLTDGVAYCYIVTAINASGESADSMQACGGMGIIQINWL